MKNRSIRRIVKLMVVVLAVVLFAGVSAAAERLVGDWEIKVTFNEREMVSTLSITQEKEGNYAGTWKSQWGETAVDDIKFEDGKVSFTRTSKYNEREFKSTYEGTIKGDTLTGKIKSERGEIEANGVRVKSAVFGKWEFESRGRRGQQDGQERPPQKRILTLNEDMTGTYEMRESEVAIKDMKVEGNTVSFKIEMSFGERSFTMEFKGTAEGDELNGEFITSRGSREAKGKRVGAKAKPEINSEEAVGELDKLIEKTKETGKVEDADAAVAVIEAAAKRMDKVELLAKLAELQESRKDSVVPRPDKVLSKNQKLDWTIISLETRGQRDVPADKVKAHPAAEAFPGAVEDSAKRVTRNVEIWTDRPGWRNRGIYAQWNKKDMQSTGMYAAPGEVVTISVPEGAEGTGLSVRIGVHTDGLWRLDRWRRAPEITRVFNITETVTKAANAFGGPVYIETPHDCTLGKFKVKIEGAVRMPWYVAGKTTDKQWKRIRDLPAPWAELQTDRVVFTLPAEHIREVENMAELMEFWDGVMDSCADLLGKDHARKRAERFATDTQISAGYMHSGYPLMAGLDIGSTLVDKARIVRNGHGGVWGLFHEIGHNHQNSLWVYGGTTEVTVNLFSLYINEKMCGLYPKDNVHGGVLPKNREKSLAKYLADGAKFDKWKSNPFLALYMYSMMQEEFGWEPFTKVFKEYRAADKSELPKNDDDKRDQWMVRMSKMVGKDLGPFFDAWGVPVSAKAKELVASLPGWMPEGFPEVKATEETTAK